MAGSSGATSDAAAPVAASLGGILDSEDFGEDIVDGPPLDGDDDDLGGTDEVFATSDSSSDDTFNQILAELETLMMDEDFNARVGAFTSKHCDEFDEGDENKLVYTTLFSEYTAMIEEYIESRLGAAIKEFDMASFCARVGERAPSFDGELPAPLEMLSAHSDFASFKELMLSAKAGKAVDALGGGPMCVSGAPLSVGGGGGAGLADLASGLSITSASPNASSAEAKPAAPASAAAKE